MLVVIDALGISLSDLDLRVEDGGSRAAQDSSAIMAAMRSQRQLATPRNPFYDGAATLDDIKPGVKLLKVYYLRGIISETTVVQYSPSSEEDRSLFMSDRGTIWHLTDAGILPYQDGQWSRCNVTVVNTQLNRLKLMLWLLKQGAGEAAVKIVEAYPDDFIVKVVVENGKLTTKVG